jgi:Domain of unknown function (DUF1929)
MRTTRTRLVPARLMAAKLAGWAACAIAACGSLHEPDAPIEGDAVDLFSDNRLLVDEGHCPAGLMPGQATLAGAGERLVLTGLAIGLPAGPGGAADADCAMTGAKASFVSVVDTGALASPGAGPLSVPRDLVAEALRPFHAAARAVAPDGVFLAFDGEGSGTEKIIRFDGAAWSTTALATTAPTGAPTPLPGQAIPLGDGGMLVVRPRAEQGRLKIERVPPGSQSALSLWPPPGGGPTPEWELAFEAQPGRLRAFELGQPGDIFIYRGPGTPLRFRLGEAGELAPLEAPGAGPPAGAVLVRLPVRRRDWGYQPGALLAVGGPAARPAPLMVYEPASGWRTVGTSPWALHDSLPVLLPDGKIAMVGGRAPADMRVVYIDPRRGFALRTGRAAMARPRSLLTSALLLPSGAVFVATGYRNGDAPQPDFQLLDPPYRQPGRAGPVIEVTSAPPEIAYGQPFQLRLAAAGGGPLEVVIMGFGSTVVGQNLLQSQIELSVVRAEEGGRLLTIGGPCDPLLAPPGRYLLFVVDEAGTPSTGVALGLPAAAIGGDRSAAVNGLCP